MINCRHPQRRVKWFNLYENALFIVSLTFYEFLREWFQMHRHKTLSISLSPHPSKGGLAEYIFGTLYCTTFKPS